MNTKLQGYLACIDSQSTLIRISLLTVLFWSGAFHVVQAADSSSTTNNNEWQVVAGDIADTKKAELNNNSAGWTSVPEETEPKSGDAGGWVSVPSISGLRTTVPEPTAEVDNAGYQSVPTQAVEISEQQKSLQVNDLRKRLVAAIDNTPEPKVATPAIREFGNAGSNASLVGKSVSDLELLRPVAVAPSIEVNNMDMFVGELKVFGKVDVTRVAIGNGGIIRAEILKTGELLIIGQSAGSTSLRLWHKDEKQSAYNIRVSENDPETRIRMERMVRLRVRLVEISKSAIGKLGIDWSDATTGPTFAAAGDAVGNNLFRPVTEGFDGLPNQVAPFSTYFGVASQITSSINFLAQNGDAVTLAEPVLSAVNGGKASFLAGGEVPYPTRGANGETTVEFKEYGVRLQVAPRIDSGGNVRTFVETEISQIDQSVSVNGAPGLLTRRAQTEVNVRSGETIVISGLLSSDSSSDVNMIPGIGGLPIIGRLFRSENKNRTVRELVIFVTPEVIEPYDSGMTSREQSLQEKSTRQLEDARSTLPLME